MSVACARCSTTVPADQTYFAAEGEVCASCHADEAASDRTAFLEGQETPFSGYDDDDFDRGGVVVHRSGNTSFSVDGGPILNFLFSLLRGWLQRSR